MQLLVYQSLLLEHPLVQVCLLKLGYANLRFSRCHVIKALIEFFLLRLQLVQSRLQLVLHFLNLLFFERELLFVEL